MAKKQQNETVDKLPLPKSARDIEPVLAPCAEGCGRITLCYSYPSKLGGFVYSCIKCRPRS